jgi:asparagine synthetase B (glutamine-hydrolysing)
VQFPRDGVDCLDSAVEEYRGAFDRAISPLVSDVPVGAYLERDRLVVGGHSGRFAARRVIHAASAFTDAPYYNERTVPARWRAPAVRGCEVEIRPADFADRIERVVWHLDEPTLGTGALPRSWFRSSCRAASGGADGPRRNELFAGYQVNQVALLKETLGARSASGVLGAIRSTVGRLYTCCSRSCSQRCGTASS